MIKSNQIKLVSLSLFLCISLLSLFNNCAPKPNEETSQSASAPDPNDVGAKFSGRINSNLQYVTNTGSVWGYASDPGNTTATLKVIFYMGGPVGTGQYVGETQANRVSPGPNSGHFFSYQLPAQFANGINHTLYAYGYEAKAEYLLYPGATDYLAFTPKAEAVFNQQINSFVQSSCTRCHSWNYTYLYSGPFLNPMPTRGGSATNNVFIRKMSGLTSHSGGVFCSGGVNAGICTEIQRWWNAEFN